MLHHICGARRLGAGVLACTLALTGALAAAPSAPAAVAESSELGDDFVGPVITAQVAKAAQAYDKRLSNLKTKSALYLAQGQGSGNCLVTANAMMLRRAAYLDGGDWKSMNDAAVVAAAGYYPKLSYTCGGYSASMHSLTGDRAAKLRALLAEHPEGVVAYDSSVPHAVLLTDYDAKTGTFYCADPADYYAGKRIAVASSWNGACRGSQAAVINGFDSYYAID